MKTRWALSMVGVVVLGLAAAGVFRELSAPGGSGQAAPGDRKPRMSEAESPRPLPDLKFIDRAGASRSLADFRGRFVLLNVWATWCTPCREEMPSLDRLQRTLGGSDFEVVALSIDRGGVFTVESFYEELDLRALRIYVDASTEALTQLRALGIPVTVFVDRSGRELWRVVGPARWDDADVVARIRAYLGPARARLRPAVGALAAALPRRRLAVLMEWRLPWTSSTSLRSFRARASRRSSESSGG